VASLREGAAACRTGGGIGNLPEQGCGVTGDLGAETIRRVRNSNPASPKKHPSAVSD
jgi:hypothetical protein